MRAPAEQRRHTRIELEHEGWRAEMIDQATGTKVGEVVNLSRAGLMIISPAAPRVYDRYELECQATGPDGQCERFSAAVMVVWCANASQPNAFWSGLQIMEIDEDSERKLDALAQRLEFF